MDFISVPGFDYLLVAGLTGKVYGFRNDPNVAAADLLLDLKRDVYSIAVHPQFARNGYLYVANVCARAKTIQVSRFVVRPGNPWRCAEASETQIFRWPFGSAHNGGAMRFGPDGYLYIGAGDGSTALDESTTGQDISDVQSSILRIDVDRPLPYRRYSIPPDNPFIHWPGARPEVWAFGLRQPWKMSFDRVTGDLWVGDVGQDRWESVHRVSKGGNYGWSVREGNHPCRPEQKIGPTPMIPPIVEHAHSEFRALIGGHVYRGQRIPELAGAYIYGDNETGQVWGVRLDGARVAWHGKLAATHLRIASFGEDHAGELYLLDFAGGQIHRLAPGAQMVQNTAFPRKLSETGLFASTQTHQPAAGVIRYDVNAALWSDGAAKERFFALPGDSRIKFEAVPNRPPVEAPLGWSFPDGTVLVKTFSLTTQHGPRRIETRLLHLQKHADTDSISDQFWRGYSYVWNEDQTDADLVDAGGLDRRYIVRDSQVQGGTRPQVWHFPSRAECTMCHSSPAKYVLGITTPQMNLDVDLDGRPVNQLELLESLGVFAAPLPPQPQQLTRLVDYQDESQALDPRARSYLHSNCAHCHIMYGGGNAAFQLQANLTLDQTGTVGALPIHGDFGIRHARLLAPGHPERSLLYHRMAHAGAGHMPPVATAEVDEQGSRLIAEWIRQIPEPSLPPIMTRIIWAVAGIAAVAIAWVVWRRIAFRRVGAEPATFTASACPPPR